LFLAIDIGNSQTSVGVFREKELLHHWRFETHVARTSDEYAALLFPLLDHASLSKTNWDGVVLCSVVPPADQSLEDFSVNYLGTRPLKVNERMRLDFTMNVTIPSEVGADRIANTAYAVERLELPCVVVDFGTATTFDVVSEKKVYEGGLILPGARLSIEALSLKTSKLPRVDLVFPPSIVGKNTIECIQSGVLYGYTDMIDGLITRLKSELGESLVIALTGGLSKLFKARLKAKTFYLPNLTLEGIEILYRANTRNVSV
jgi:type III pantothenate kinase